MSTLPLLDRTRPYLVRVGRTLVSIVRSSDVSVVAQGGHRGAGGTFGPNPRMQDPISGRTSARTGHARELCRRCREHAKLDVSKTPKVSRATHNSKRRSSLLTSLRHGRQPTAKTNYEDRSAQRLLAGTSAYCVTASSSGERLGQTLADSGRFEPMHRLAVSNI